ncbi:MAG: PAS domain S-box protein [Deltaproteobacteria bacterium]|nr:PAS domain S-box protein [Deltaproteobacteria bacterium]
MNLTRIEREKGSGVMKTIISAPSKIRTALIAILVGVAFYFGAKLGLALSTPHLTAALQGGYSVQRALIFYTANCTEILVAALALKLILGNRLKFDRLREMVMFLLWAVLIAPVVSAFMASMATFAEPTVNYWLAWRVWFLGDALGHLTLTPLIILWISFGLGWVKEVSFARLIEVCGLVLCLFAVGFFSLGVEIGDSGNFPALLYTPLPVLLWAAIRFGPRGICSAVLVITLLAIWNAINGRVPFTANTPADNVLSLQLFLLVVSVPTMLLGTLLSERKQAEEALRQSEAQLRTLIETLPDLVWLKDPGGVYLSCNQKFERFFGAKQDEIVGKTDHNFVDKELADFFREKDKVAMAAGKPTMNEEEVVYADDGHREILETIKTPMFDRNGKLIGVLGVGHDITNRKKVETTIRKSEEQWDRTFNAITDIVTLQDTSMKIVKVNQSGCHALDLTCENIIGKYCYELFHGSNEPCAGCPLLVTKETFEPYTKEMTHEKLGKTFLVSASPVVNEDGTLTHIAHVAKDITEKKKIEERLFLNEKLATIAGLAAGVAHEINTPLSGILQSQQMIEMRLDPDKPRNQERAAECGVDLSKVQTYFKNNELDTFMKGMRDSAITAGNIIKNLLEFSRPHKGEIKNANLSNLLDTTLELARSDYDLKRQYDIINVEIVKEYDPELTEVPCVAMEFEQVVLNLIKNAVHAMTDNNTESPCITIRTAKTEKMARIEVEDNGPGIDEETKQHIFDPFFTTKEVGRGTGLGLSVSHALVVDKHRGNIWVESEPGEGAKFIIELPLVQEA